jgi:hypothetical protein
MVVFECPRDLVINDMLAGNDTELQFSLKFNT